MAVAFLCGGLQYREAQADVTVLKRYAGGSKKQDAQLEGRWFSFRNDADLLEIIFVKDNHRFDEGVKSVDMRGCVNLTNIVILDDKMGNADFVVDKETKLKRIVSAIPKVRIFRNPEEGEDELVRLEEKEREVILRQRVIGASGG